MVKVRQNHWKAVECPLKKYVSSQKFDHRSSLIKVWVKISVPNLHGFLCLLVFPLWLVLDSWHICMSIMILSFTRLFYHIYLFSLSKVTPTKAKLFETYVRLFLLSALSIRFFLFLSYLISSRFLAWPWYSDGWPRSVLIERLVGSSKWSLWKMVPYGLCDRSAHRLSHWAVEMTFIWFQA